MALIEPRRCNIQAQTRDKEQELARGFLVSAYLQLVQDLPFVEAVFIDPSAGLTIYTIYRGELRDIEDSLYRAESEARKHAPKTGTMFRLLDGSHGGDLAGLPRSAQRVYSRE
jgi:hypothetical protein